MKKPVSYIKLSRIIFLFVSLLWQNNVAGQQTAIDAEIEIGYNLTKNSEIPFWQRANNYGTQQQSGNNAYISQKTMIYGHTKNNKYKYEITTGTWFTVEEDGKIILTELNAKITYGNSYIKLGRFKEHYGLTDSTTSSGSITFSNNSLPIPQIKIGCENYKKIIFPFVFVKGHFSHGWFGNQSMTKNYFLHQKSVSFRIGKEASKVNVFAALLHNAQWGGFPKYQIGIGDKRYINDRFPSGWYTYRNIVFPLFNPKADSTANISSFDYENRLGNHIGQIDIGGSVNMPFSKIKLYKQIIFETGQTFSSLTNIDDGLYGISYLSKLSEPFTKRISLEYFQTTNQGMYRPGLLRLLGFEGKHYGRNRNNYYNHNQYLDGWSYNGSNIGSPFVIPKSELNLQENQIDSGYRYLYNRVKAIYLGAENYVWNLKFLTKLSFSKNYSLYDVQLQNKEQFSGNVSCSKVFYKNKNSITMAVGMDKGDLIPNNFGIQMTWKKLW